MSATASLFGLIAVYAHMGKKKEARRAARRFLELVESFDPKLRRASAKQVAYAKTLL